MAYTVTIAAPDGRRQEFACGGASDQEALIYAGKVVEANAGAFPQDAVVSIARDGEAIGPRATVRDMTTRAV